MDEVVLQEKQGDITILSLNRPDSLNAINAALLASLVAHIHDNRNSRTLVLQGMGRAFCAGEDLKETLTPHQGNADELRSALEALQEITRLLTSLPCPVIAAVHGFAVGAGAEIALLADLVVASPQTRFRFPEVLLGHAPTEGITARLTAMVGLMRAKELLLTGRWLDAVEAHAIGMVTELAENPQARARELAQQLAPYAHRSFSTTKRGIELAAFPHQETILQAEIDAASYCFASQEAMEGFAAFRKRKQES